METGTITLTIVKPHAVLAGHTGEIFTMINRAGFEIKALKLTKLSRPQAEQFYAIHAGQIFFERLIKCMTEGPIMVAILKKDNAVRDFRSLIGSTDPKKATPGTIRHKFGIGQPENAVHGSDSDENALIESNFFFNQLEIVG